MTNVRLGAAIQSLDSANHRSMAVGLSRSETRLRFTSAAISWRDDDDDDVESDKWNGMSILATVKGPINFSD